MRPDSLELLAAWVTVLVARDLAERTIASYSYAVQRLLAFHRFQVHPMDLDEGHIAAFLASLSSHAPAKEQYAKGIGSFTRWLHRHGYLAIDPVTDVTPRRRQRKPAVRYERDEITRMLAAARDRDPSGRRAWAILGCLSLGTRRSEFVSIRRDDIDWSRRRVYLRVTKGRRPREVPIGPWAEEALHELEAISPLGQPYLVPIRPSTLNAWVHQAAIEAGIAGDRKQRAHTLRASFASYLLEQNVPIPVVRDLLGHSSIATTDAYAAAGPGSGEEAVKILSGAL